MSQPVADRPSTSASVEAPGARTFRVLEENLPALTAEIERLGRRAERLGEARISLRDTGRRNGRHAFVVLEGEPPALLGWTLAAIVDHRDDVPTIRVVATGAPPLDSRRFTEPRCEHCHLRRRRSQTFVLRHAATGSLRQVGSGCLRDFLGGHDVARLCRQAEYTLLARQALVTASGQSRTFTPEPVGVPLDRFAAHAAMVVRANGWMSRERAQRLAQIASADAALRSLQATPDAARATDRAIASAALAWARELLAAKPELSEFERDAIAVVSRGTVVTGRDRGLVCALIAIYRQRLQRSRHLGEVSEWLDAVVLVERHLERPSARHGTVCRHDLVDIDGNRLVWWQTRGTSLPAGRAVYLRGRVERHAHFGRTAITVLARCRLLDGRPRD
jgi:hypothetical protein